MFHTTKERTEERELSPVKERHRQAEDAQRLKLSLKDPKKQLKGKRSTHLVENAWEQRLSDAKNIHIYNND